jgi:exodeoxyribonuclease V gamma subunit
MMEAEPCTDLRALARAGTELPTGTWAEAPLSAELEGLQAFADRVRALSPGEHCAPLTVDASVDLDGTRWRITGAIQMASASGTLAWRHAPLRATDRLHTWITLLALGASSPQAPRDAHFVAQDSTLRLHLPTDPSLHLRSLLDLYRRGLSEPLHFFPGAAWAYVAKGGSLKAAREVWRPQRDAYAESDDPAYRLALRGTADPLDASFEDLAQRVFKPLSDHINEQP